MAALRGGSGPGRVVRCAVGIPGLDLLGHRRRIHDKWVGYPDHEATWKRANELPNCQDIIQEFEDAGTTSPEGEGM